MKAQTVLLESTLLNVMAVLKGLWINLRSAARKDTQFSEDAAERDADRNRRAALSGITAATARAVQIGASLVTVPLTIRYLGNERFGLWITMSSFLIIAGFADFGLGNGLLHSVARLQGKDDIAGVKRAISSAFASLSFLSAGLLVLFLSVHTFIPWADLFRVVSSQARAEAGPAMLVFGVCFALNLPAGVVQRVQMGLQQGFRANIWQLAGSVIGLIGLTLGIRFHEGLPTLVFAIVGGPLLAGVLNTALFFSLTSPDLKPRWGLVSRQTISEILSIGILFFLLQVVVAVAYSADNFVVARTLGVASVPDYAIPQRMFGVIAMMISMLVSPLWPAYGEAMSRGDLDWVRRSLFRSVSIVLLVSIAGSAALLLGSYKLINWWVGPTVHPPLLLLIGLAVWTVMECGGNTLGVFLNGAGLIRFQILVACIFGIGCITAKVYLTRRFGIVGLPWATIATAGLFSYLPLILYLRYQLRSQGDRGAGS